MHSSGTLLALVSSLVPLACLAQTPAKPATADYSSEAIVFDKSETTYRMHADGTGERDMHVVLRIQSDGAAQQFGVLSFAYASAYESPQIKLVRVHKADGTTVDTPAADVIDMSADVTREAPLYSDLKEKHLPVRSLARGDTLEYEVDTAINKPEAPGQFWGASHFSPPGTVIVLSEIVTLEVPADKYVQVWSPNHKPTVTEANGLRTYTWNVPQLVTAPRTTSDDSTKVTPPKDPDEDADGRKIPSIAWTTFHGWTEVGDWYRTLATPEAQPTDALRARANEITAKADTPEAQVRAIYSYVSSHTRYIGIDFGIGRYKPHSAADVLANQYGDCKDKDTLLEALLHAKGFVTAPALIGAGIAPVPDVPSPAVFNHVITTVNLPSGRIWLDSTPLAAPFQYLTAIIRDQKALVVPVDAPATLVSTPANAPYSFVERFEATGTLDAEGKMNAKMTASYRDDQEVLVRALARTVAPAEWDKASQFLSAHTGFGGTTSNTQFTNGDDIFFPIVLKYDYARHPFGDWDNLRIVPLFPALEFSPLESDSNAPDNDIQLGAPRTLNATSHIHLPAGFRPDFPDPIHVKTDFATFDKTYRFEGDEIIAERNVTVLKSKIPKSDWKKYQAFTKDISLTGENWIQLIKPSKPIVIQIPSPSDGASPSTANPPVLKVRPPAETQPSTAAAPPPSDLSTTDLMALSLKKMQAQDWAGARQALDQLRAKSPNQKGLWSSYGYIAEVGEKNTEEAKEDFRKEIEQQPDNGMLVDSLAQLQNRTGDSVGARHTLSAFLEHHPDNLHMSMFLATLQTSASDDAGALKTLEAAADQNPDNRYVRVQIGESLVRLGRNDEAAAAAKSALDGADDPGLLNDAAYVLSEANSNLDIAEEASRKSIAKMEEDSAKITTAEANSRAFGSANLLIASWDTLGWIFYQEGKLDAAKSYLSAAWRASLQADVGNHLGQLYEAKGQKDEASTTFALAQGALNSTSTPDVRKQINDSVQRLKKAGAKPGPANPTAALQDLRTYKITRPDGASGWGTFRLEVTTDGVIESQQMSGEKHLAVIKPVIDAMKFPELLPTDS